MFEAQSPLIGQDRVAISDSGVLRLPERHAAQLGLEVVCSYWVDGCIGLWPRHLFDATVAPDVGRREAAGQLTRHAARVIASSAEYVPVTETTITVSGGLLNQAGIGRSAVLIGNLDHLEIHEPDRFGELFERGLRDLTSEPREKRSEG